MYTVSTKFHLKYAQEFFFFFHIHHFGRTQYKPGITPQITLSEQKTLNFETMYTFNFQVNGMQAFQPFHGT